MYIYLDIETIPGQEPGLRDRIERTIVPPGNLKLQKSLDIWWEEKQPAAVELAYRKTALSGTYGEVLAIAWALGDDPVQVVDRELGQPESAVLAGFMSRLKEDLLTAQPESVQDQPNPSGQRIWVGHYATGFDFRFLWQRCVINRIKMAVPIPYKAQHWDRNVVDTYHEWVGTKSTAGDGSLEVLCHALGYPGKGELNGALIWDYVQAGRYPEIRSYVIDDVEKVRQIHQAMQHTCLP